MATEIDKRVVEMQFDNKDFEKNCQASLTTLEKLKMALNFDGAKGLESMGKAVNKLDFSNITKGADAIQVKFSAIQVAGMTMISELTKSFMNFGKNVWNASLGQIKTGGLARSLKMDQAKFQMKALAGNMESVKNGLVDSMQIVTDMIGAANDAVDGTAYGLDAASAVASQLMASGLTNAKEMFTHLRAIAGAASMTGRSYEDIGNIFTTVASNGRLMTMQLRQFSAAGLNLSATLAQSAKYAGKTEEQINEMVTKGKISFQDFSDALYEAYGDAAGKADETWSGVTSNVRAQLSKIGQIFTDPFVENFIPVLATVKQKLKDIRSVLTPISETWKMLMKFWSGNINTALDKLDMARLQPIANGIENILATLIMIIGTVRRAFMEMFPPKTLDELHTAANIFEAMTRKLIPAQETLDGFKEVVKAFLIPLKLAFEILREFSQKMMKPLALAFAKLLGSILQVGKAIAPVVEKIVEAISKTDFFASVLYIVAQTLITIIEALGQFFLAFNEVLGKAINSETFQNFLDLLLDISSLLSNIIVNVLNAILFVIEKIFSIVKKENILNLFEGIGNIFKVLIVMISAGINTIIAFIDYCVNSGNILGKIFTLIGDIFQLIKDVLAGNDVTGSLAKIKETIDGIVSSLKSLFSTLVEELHNLNGGKILIFSFGVAMLFLVGSIIKFINAGTGLVKAATGFFGVFDGLKKAIANIGRFTPVFQAFLGIVFVISAVTTALVTLSQIEDTGKLIAAAVSLGVISTVLIGLAIAVQFLQKVIPEGESKGLNAVMQNVLAISASVLVFAVAMRLLMKSIPSKEEWAGMLVSLGVIFGLVATLTGASVVLATAAKDGFKGSLAIMAFAATLLILVKAFKQLVALDLSGNILSALSALVACIGLMLALSFGMYLVGKSGITAGAGLAFMGFVLSLLGVVAVLKKLSEFQFEDMKHALKNMALLMSPIVAFMIAAVAAVKISKQGSIIKDLAEVLLAFNLTLITLMATVGILGSFSGPTLAKGILAIGGLSLILTLVTASLMESIYGTKGIDYKLAVGEMRQMNKFILAVSGAMILLAIAAKIIDTVDVDGIINTGILFGLVGWWLTNCIELTQKTKDAKMGPLIAIITSMSFIIAALAILSFQDPIQLAAAGLAIGLALAGLAAVMAFVNGKDKPKPKDAEETKKTDKAVLTICVGISSIVLALAGLTYVTKYIDPNKVPILEEVLIAMAGLLVAVAVFVAMAGRADSTKLADNTKSMAKMLIAASGALIIMAVAIGGLAVLSHYIGDESFFKIGVSVIALGLMCNAIVKVVNEIMNLEFKRDQKNRSSLYKAANTFVIFAAGLVVIATAVGELTTILAGLQGWGVSSLILGCSAIIVMVWAITKAMNELIKAENSRKKQKGEMTDVATSMVVAASSMAVIAGALSILVTAMGAHPIASMAHIVLACVAIGVLAGIVFYALHQLIGKSAGLDRTAVMRVGTTMVIAASSMAVIAAALAGLSTVMSKFSSFGSVMGSVLAILSLFVPMVVAIGAIVWVVKKGDVNVTAINAIRWLFISMTAMLMVIAGTLTVLAYLDIGDMKEFQKKVNALVSITKTITTFITVISAMLMVYNLLSQFSGLSKGDGRFGFNIAKGGEPKDLSNAMYALAIMFTSVSISFGIIAAAITSTINAISGANARDVEKAKKILLLFGGLIVALVGIMGLLAGFGGGKAGTTFAITLGVIAAAILAFCLSMLSVAKAVDTMVDAVEKINNLKMDANKLRTYFSESIKGIAKGIMDAIPEILAVFGLVLVAIATAFAFWKLRAIVEVVAAVIGIVYAIKEALPYILPIITDIMNTIIGYLSDDKNMGTWQTFFEKIGELMFNVISGICKGLFNFINKEIDALVEKYEETQKTGPAKRKERQFDIQKRYEFAKKYSQMLNEMGRYNSIVDADENELNELAELYSRRATLQAKNMEMLEVDANRLNELEAKYLDASGNFQMTMLQSNEKTEATFQKNVDNMTRDQWLYIVESFNNQMEMLRQKGLGADEEYYRQLAENMRIPAEYMKYFGAEYAGYHEDILNDLVMGNNTMIKNIRETRETVTEEAKETAKEAVKVVDEVQKEEKEVSIENLKSSGQEVLGTVKTITKNVSDAVVDGLGGAGGLAGGIVDTLNNISVGDFNLGELASGLIKETGIMGKKAGDELGEDFINTVDWWIDYGKEKIITNLQAYEYSGQQSGFQYRYQQEGYNNVNEYADAMVKAHEATDATADKTSFANKALQAFYKTMGLSDEEVKNMTGSVDDLSSGLSNLADDADKTKSKLEEFRDGVHDSIAQAMHGIFDEVKEQEYISPEEMLNRMSANIVQVSTWARNIATLAARGMSEGLLNELKDMGPQGAAKVQAFVDMTDEQLQAANRRWKAAEFMPDYGTKEIEQAYRNAGFSASLGFSNGIDPDAAKGNALALVNNTLDTIEGPDGLDINSPSKKTMKDGESATEGFAIGLTDSTSQAVLRTHTRQLASMIFTGFKNEIKPQKFKELAFNVSDGFSDGMANRLPQILSKVSTFCNQIINMFMRVLRTHSPSKVMEEIGEYTMDGFGIGFEDGAENVEKLSEQTANDIINQMKANIAAVTNGWSEDNVYQPVIRPVFDMDAINQGYTDIQSWFANSQGLNLNGNISRLTPTTREDDMSTQQIIDAINGINNDDVVNEIGALRDDISTLQSAITSMQVVMNTGALVGQLVEPMDKALGNRVLTNTRGRY